MKKRDLTAKNVSTIPCPTCGAGIGRRCILTTGRPRFKAHVNRRLGALEMFERKAGTVEENCGQEGVGNEEVV
jgi:hypothetical protein